MGLQIALILLDPIKVVGLVLLIAASLLSMWAWLQFVGKARRRIIVSRVLAALRAGDLRSLLGSLDQRVVLRADPVAVQAGAPELVQGPADVANALMATARGAQLALVQGIVSLALVEGGQARLVIGTAIAQNKIVEVGLFADPEQLRGLDVKVA